MEPLEVEYRVVKGQKRKYGKFYCEKHGYRWVNLPSCGNCPSCAREQQYKVMLEARRIKHETEREYPEWFLNSLNSEDRVKADLHKISSKSKVTWKCSSCGEERLVTVYNIIKLSTGEPHFKNEMLCTKCQLEKTRTPESYRRRYELKKQNGTFMRSQLELDIEALFGGQHSSPEFKYELDVYFPELHLGIEVDDRTHASKRPNYHHEKQEYFKSLGIKVLHLSLSPDAIRRPGYNNWKELVQAFLNNELDEEYLIMWDDPYHING